MRRTLVLAAVAALAVARPEMYKEKEDFQYTRSSSDDGTKSGFYGAQRGNMGGNYERAHNMDSLAQHQMGGLVRTVEGELGEGAKQKSGSVFSEASSRGVYGSGHYDLSNLQGRNFQEGTTYGDSQSHSSLSSQQSGYGSQSYRRSSAKTAYGSQSQSSRYHQTASGADQSLYSNTMHSADNLQASSDYDGSQISHGNGYYQAGYQGQSVYDQTAAAQQTSNLYGSSNTRGSHYRLVGVSPVKVYVRPGSTVTIPVAAQSFDASHGSAAVLDQNSVNSEVESLSHDHSLKPGAAKHYESSYSYRKEWEKHDNVPVTAVPLAIPTFSPYPANSELYEDTQASEHRQESSSQESRNLHSSSQYNGYNIKSGSSRHHAASSTYGHSASDVNQAASSNYGHSASDAAVATANTHGAYANTYGASNLNSANLNSQVEDFRSKPKSYQSSYSYHKSWERQGDPYVIQPAANGLYTSADSLSSQQLTSASLSHGANSHQYGARYHQGHAYNADCDCDENGHIRVARSYNVHQNQEYTGQQSQNLEDFGQQSQNLEEFGQQSQKLEDFGQQSQNLEDFGQQSQNLEDLGQQSQNLEDLGQQSQNLEDLGQQSQNLEDFGQQSQKLEDFGQQSQKLEDFGQQTQDLAQEVQNHYNRFEDLGQQTQNQWDQQSQTNLGQETQNTWSMFQPSVNNQQQITNQQQGNFFDITHPSQYEPFQVDRTKPIFFGPSNDKDQATTDIQKDRDVMQSEDMGQSSGQHTHYYWQSVQTNINQDGQSAYVPMTPYKQDGAIYVTLADWQKYHGQNQYQHGSHQTGLDQNSWIFNLPTSHDINTGNYGQTSTRDESTYGTLSPGFSQQHVPSAGHVYTQTQYYTPPMFPNTYNQIYTHSNQSTSYTINTNENSGSTSLTNLWSFLDDTEKQTLPGADTNINVNSWDQNNKDEQTQTNFDMTHIHHNTYNSYDKVHSEKENEQSNVNSHGTQNFNYNTFQDVTVKSTTTTRPITTTPYIERGDIAPEKRKPQEEAGRGDIGPENVSDEDLTALNIEETKPTKPLEMVPIEPTKRTPYKTPEEIETLSLTTVTDKVEPANSGNAVNAVHDKEDEMLSVISLSEQKYEHSELQRDLAKLITTSTTPKTVNAYLHNFHEEQTRQQNTEQFQQTENVEQQNIDIGQEHDTVGQQKEGFQQESFGDFSQQEGLGDFGQKESLANFGQQESLGDFGQQESLGDFGQKESLAKFGQQESLGDFGQQENIGDFGQQESLGDFGQQENLGDLGQKESLVNFGQQESLGDFGQQESLANFGQQESLGDLGQQESLANFGQQESLGDFSHHEQFQQESIPSFDQQSENLFVAPKEAFGQQTEDLEQQSQTDLWKPSNKQTNSEVEMFALPTPYSKEGKSPDKIQEPVMESEIVTKKIINADTPPEPTTEKPGFWNKVGSKLSSAKDKVKSWFSSS